MSRLEAARDAFGRTSHAPIWVKYLRCHFIFLFRAFSNRTKAHVLYALEHEDSCKKCQGFVKRLRARSLFCMDSRVLNKNVKSFICFFTTRFQRNQPFLSEGFLLQFDSKFSGRYQHRAGISAPEFRVISGRTQSEHRLPHPRRRRTWKSSCRIYTASVLKSVSDPCQSTNRWFQKPCHVT